MNKRFSTLVAAFAAIATVSYAQIGDKYVHLKTSSTYLTWDKASLYPSCCFPDQLPGSGICYRQEPESIH